MSEFDKVFNKDKSLFEAIRTKDKKLIKEIEDKVAEGEIVRIM